MINTEEWAKRIREHLENTDGPTISILITRGAAEDLAGLFELAETNEDFEPSFMMGFEYGYQTAIKDVIKHLGGMKWYGGNKPKKRAD